MVEEVTSVLRVANDASAVTWYQRLGFTGEWEHRSPGLYGSAPAHEADEERTVIGSAAITCASPGIYRKATAVMTSTMSRGVSSAEGTSQSQRTTRTGLPGRHGPRMVSSGEALTLTEVKSPSWSPGATQHRTSPGHVLVRRTVQTYISRILTKLSAKNQREIVQEALRQGISPERDSRPMHRCESVVI
jgi:hypothetical protein